MASWPPSGYAPGGGPDKVHAVLSVTKSLAVVAEFFGPWRARRSDPAAATIPELASCRYAGRLRAAPAGHAQRAPRLPQQDYTDPEQRDPADGRWPRASEGSTAICGRSLPSVRTAATSSIAPRTATWAGCRRRRPPGHSYRQTDRELVGRPWAPRRNDADIMSDRTGTAIHDGGLSATARTFSDSGTCSERRIAARPDGGSREVLPPRWLRQAWRSTHDIRSAFWSRRRWWHRVPGGLYRNQFWFVSGSTATCCFPGNRRQLLYVVALPSTVCVSCPGWPDAQNPAYFRDTLRACDAVERCADSPRLHRRRSPTPRSRGRSEPRSHGKAARPLVSLTVPGQRTPHE